MKQSLFHAPLGAVIPVDIQNQSAFTISPNPCRDETTVGFKILESTNVILTLYNVNGKFVGEFINSRLDPGQHEIKVNTRELSEDSYYVKLERGRDIKTGKIVRLR